jgi:hypothetical protein
LAHYPGAKIPDPDHVPPIDVSMGIGNARPDLDKKQKKWKFGNFNWENIKVNINEGQIHPKILEKNSHIRDVCNVTFYGMILYK